VRAPCGHPGRATFSSVRPSRPRVTYTCHDVRPPFSHLEVTRWLPGWSVSWRWLASLRCISSGAVSPTSRPTRR